MKEPEVRVLLHIEGDGFTGSAPVEEVISMLSNYHKSFSVCLDMVAKRVEVGGIPSPHLRVRFQAAAPGSLDISTIVDSMIPMSPAALDLVRLTWTIYKEVPKLIAILSSYFNREKKPMPIQLDHSPNAIAIVNTGNNNTFLVVHPLVMEAASSTRSQFAKMAAIVKSRMANLVSLKALIPETESDPIEINRDNHSDLDIPSAIIEDTTPIIITGAIYRLNTQTRKGSLEMDSEDGTKRRLSFDIDESQDLSPYIDALKASSVTLTITRDMETNALGESTVKNIHLVGIATTKS